MNNNEVNHFDEFIQNAIVNASSAWIFQWNPDDHDTFNDFASGKKTEPWRVNAHWSRIEKGDIALLWKTSSGSNDSYGEAGVYALGVLKEFPYKAPSNDVCKYRVIVEYLIVLPIPLIKSSMQRHPVLKTFADRVTRGSNFQVTDEEWDEVKFRLLNDVTAYRIQQNGPPHRRSIQSMQFVRDSNMVKKIKQEVQHKCQICNHTIAVGNGVYYSQGHHLRPLGNDHNGTDDEDNIIILCPNHHIEFDYGLLAIDTTSLTVIHINKSNPHHGKELAYKRYLNPESLMYHQLHIFDDGAL